MKMNLERNLMCKKKFEAIQDMISVQQGMGHLYTINYEKWIECYNCDKDKMKDCKEYEPI